MIDFSKAESVNYPYPYMVIDKCFDNETLNNLIKEFPDVSAETTVMGGRKKMSTGNSKFHSWVQTTPTWMKFYNWINNDTIFHSFIDYYEEDLHKWNSNITPNCSLSTDCSLHIDWSSSTDGYVREIHRDMNKRIINFLIFFNDKEWEGGDFIIHSSDNINQLDQQLWNTQLPIYKTIEAKKNLGIFFLSTPDSYHSVSLQQNTKTPRKFIYGSFSYKSKYGDVFNKRVK